MPDGGLVSYNDFQDACETNMGWCTVCLEFTREHTEPDAQGYDCPDCGQFTVCGAEMAYVAGLFTIDDLR